jgi:hypothetical protein
MRSSQMSKAPILQAIAYGIQAPNPHNTQAWKFNRVSDTEALLFVDERRLLPATDPLARQIHIGAGCLIETLAVGMSDRGFETEVELLPRGAHGLDEVGRKPVARIALRPGASRPRDELADAIGRRQTNRKPYSGPPLTDEEAREVRRQVRSDGIEVLVLDRPEEMRPLLDIFYRAEEIEAKTPHLWEETRIWFRFNERQRRAQRDGLSIPQTGIDGGKRLIAEWSLRNGNPRRWFSPLSIGPFLKRYRRGIDSARGLVLLKTKTNRQSDWLEAGRSFARVTLALTKLGLTTHPYSQVLQELPEMAELQARFNQRLGVREPEKVQMAVRVGRAERAYAAPRRDPNVFISPAGMDADVDAAPPAGVGDHRVT